MTPCQKLGYKVGDWFEVLEEGCGMMVGEKIQLEKDDGSDCPLFRANTRGRYNLCRNGAEGAYKDLGTVKKIEKQDEKESTAKWLKDNSWFIAVNGEQEYFAAVKWIEDHGKTPELSNKWVKGIEALRSSNYAENVYIRTDMAAIGKEHKEIKIQFETIVKSFTLPAVETEQEKKIRELQETIDKASAQIKAIKEGM